MGGIWSPTRSSTGPRTSSMPTWPAAGIAQPTARSANAPHVVRISGPQREPGEEPEEADPEGGPRRVAVLDDALRPQVCVHLPKLPLPDLHEQERQPDHEDDEEDDGGQHRGQRGLHGLVDDEDERE